MAREKRHNVKGYDGVYYVLRKPPGGKRPEKVFYIRYRKFDEKKGGNVLIEEKAGWEKRNDMTPARAFSKRARRIAGEEPTNAEERETKRREKLAESQAKLEEQNKWTIQRLWDEYSEQREDNKSFRTDKGRYEKYLKDPFGEKEPNELLQLDVDRVRVKLLKKKSPQTVKHVLALLKRITKFGTDRGLCDAPRFAIKLPRVDNKKTEFLTQEEIKRLLEAIEKDKHHQAGDIMKMALFTGMRRSEILGLKWSDVDFQNGFINIAVSKGGRAQKIPLNDGAREVLQGIKKGKGAYVFPGNLGNKRSNINRAINAIKTAAKLPEDFRPLHGLRHTYASMLVSSGVDLFAVQKLLTHKDHRMTERYAHLHDDALKKAAGVASDIIGQAMNGNKKTKIRNAK